MVVMVKYLQKRNLPLILWEKDSCIHADLLLVSHRSHCLLQKMREMMVEDLVLGYF